MLIDFWTYTCINCIRTLPYLRVGRGVPRRRAHDRRRARARVRVRERRRQRRRRDRANGIAYPVVQDNEFGTWTAFGNQYWPAKYLIDADGEVRYAHFGEGAYEETEAAIRSLLAEAGDERLGGGRGDQRAHRPGLRTPETYLGSERAQGWVEAPRAGTATTGRRAAARPEPVRLRRPLA